MNIVKEHYFHIQRIKTWDINSELLIGLDKNNFIKELEKERKILVNGLSQRDIEIDTEKQKANYFSDYHMYVRENVFESIRIELFPEKPSRMKGLWVCDKENLDYWLKKLDNGSVFEIELTGKIHKANAINLSSDGAILSRKQYEEQALRYWSGVNTDLRVGLEFLFTGSLKVISKHN